MPENSCPVHRTLLEVRTALDASRLTTPRSRRIAEEIRDLLQDIALGRGGSDHLPAVFSLVDDLAGEAAQDASGDLAGRLREDLDSHREVFQSHIDTHNCAAGDCVRLAPAPCQVTCPAGLDVPTYVTLIGMGRDAEAVDVIRRDCPFPWVCGLVCTRPCEFMCVRGRIDTPISIKSLKGFAAERAMSEGAYRNPEKAPDKGKRVCVVGAGPGGLSCAYYLALKGYGVRVIESQSVAGGMLLLGIPRYRLPREVIDRETAMLKELGVSFSFNTRFGKDVTFDDLREEGYDAIFLAIGAHRTIKLRIPGEDESPNVIDAVHFLRQVALGEREAPGRRVVVVGGGNVAIDAARTALRLGCRDVVIAYRRTREEMPADHEEVEQAEEEGIRFSFLTVPVEVVHDQGELEGLRCLEARLIQVEGKDRMYPKPIEGSEYLMAADVIILAIGQKVDTDCLSSMTEIGWSRRNTVRTNMVTMETDMEGVFAAGDAVTGPATVIEAIGGGKRAAEAIDRYVSGIPQPEMPPVPVRRGRAEHLEVPAITKMTLKRPENPLLNIDRRRTTFQQVELGYPENAAREEARRCLRCDVCLRCGKCVETCRDKMGINALQMGYFDFDHPVSTDFRVTGERCILCGACATNCPTGAMQMQDVEGERVLSLCGTILNRQRLVRCEGCGAVLGPSVYLDYVRKRTEHVARVTDTRRLCEACLRRGTTVLGAEEAPVERPPKS